MLLSFPVRFTLLIVVLTIFVVGIAELAFKAWQQVGALQSRFESVQRATLTQQDQLSQMIQSMQRPLVRFLFGRKAADAQEFQARSKLVSEWMAQAAKNADPQQVALVQKFQERFNRYQTAAQNLSLLPSFGRDQLQQLDGLLDSLDAIATELTVYQAQRLIMSFEVSQSTVHQLKWVINITLCLVMGLSVYVGLGIYRNHIHPLRRTLVLAQQAMEKQEKLASLGTLTAGVAHEIRNPLTAVKARVFTLKRNLHSNSPEHEDAVAIGQEIDRLEKLVQEVLLFGKQTAPAWQSITTGELLQSVLALLAPQARGHEVCLEISDQAALDIPVRCDPHQIKQVLINLVRNGIESMRDGGVVTLLSRKILEADKAWVVLEVQDNGSGITPEVRARLFDPFFTTKPSGTGLGLSLSLRICEQHGGSLECETMVGKGSVFRMKLPLEK
jgi:signal transduction histidine kinase